MMVALALAGIVAFVAFKARLLTVSGALAATFVGAATWRAGPGWVVLLLVFFVSANALSRWRREERARLVGSIVEKGDRRDAAQVLANGLVFAVAAIGASVGDLRAWSAIGAGAIASATADTWSTEIGTVIGGTPRHLFRGHPVRPGTSGGVTLAGTVAAAGGAALATLVVMFLRWDVAAVSVLAGGIAGSLTDSVLGATLQERRWCTHCDLATERRTHRCGSVTERRGGIPSFDNDAVNLASILVGGMVTWALA